jgi:predicted nucleic acid-binding protein
MTARKLHMATLPDTSLWIALTRARSPRVVKALVAPHIDDPDACLAEPIVFELLRGATDAEALQLSQHFQYLPLLASPANLWGLGAELGRACRRAGLTVGSIDLLIAALAIHHDAELVTFDTDFPGIAGVSGLRVKLLKFPTP